MSHSTSLERRSRLPFLLRQLHSLTGVLPVGVFMLLQLWANAKAVQGPEAYGAAFAWMLSLPGAVVWQVLVLGPLAFHAFYGLWLAARSEYSVNRYPHSRNWSYVLQRATGIIAFAFIGYHALRFWLPVQRGQASLSDVYFALERSLSATVWEMPLLALGYMIGLGACAFHVGHGLATFLPRWGFGVSRAGRSRAAALGAIVGLTAFALGANTVVFLATGWRIVGEPAAVEAGQCGQPPGGEEL